MILDCHIHLNSPGCRYDQAEVDHCLQLADRAGIERMVYLFNLADTGSYDPRPDHIRQSNDLGLELANRHPDRFISYCYLHPGHDPVFNLAEIDRCIVHGPAAGIKLWVSVHATDARLDPIMRRAAELRVPVLHHAWYKANGFAFNESTPKEIANLAKRHPDVPIVMAHLAGGGVEGVYDVLDCPNVVVDTSGAQPLAGMVEFAIRHLGPDRVVFGSDWPLRDFAVQKARVTGATADPEVQALVLGGTMARILSASGKVSL
jgi:predicted TIM-barrel fold metal-dependent hydrolase